MGFAVAGGKRRKYAALIPWLQSQGIQQVAVIGSLHSKGSESSIGGQLNIIKKGSRRTSKVFTSLESCRQKEK